MSGGSCSASPAEGWGEFSRTASQSSFVGPRPWSGHRPLCVPAGGALGASWQPASKGARALASRQLSAWRESPAVPAPCGRDHPCCQPRAGGSVHGAERRSGRPGPHGRAPPLPSAAPGNDPVRTASLSRFRPTSLPSGPLPPQACTAGATGRHGGGVCVCTRWGSARAALGEPHPDPVRSGRRVRVEVTQASPGLSPFLGQRAWLL